LVTSAIDVAAEGDQNRITDAIIERAWAELQQLPSPMIEEPSLRQNSSAIEFGELDDTESYEFTGEPKNGEHESVASENDGHVEGETEAVQTYAYECSSELSDLCHASQASDLIVADETDVKVQDEESLAKTPVADLTPAPQELFGDFDEEEEVWVGNGVSVTQQFDNGTTIDLEEMLHSEIIGIASDASQASHFAQAEDKTDRYSDRLLSFTEQNSVQWLDEVEGVDAAIDDDSDIVIQDDTDMLVIEDEVDLRAAEPTSRIDGEEKVVSVDFQAMLSRMRHGMPREAS
jgi:hypothetical protein